MSRWYEHPGPEGDCSAQDGHALEARHQTKPGRRSETTQVGCPEVWYDPVRRMGAVSTRARPYPIFRLLVAVARPCLPKCDPRKGEKTLRTVSGESAVLQSVGTAETAKNGQEQFWSENRGSTNVFLRRLSVLEPVME
jgi:hypothetical protein